MNEFGRVQIATCRLSPVPLKGVVMQMPQIKAESFNEGRPREKFQSICSLSHFLPSKSTASVMYKITLIPITFLSSLFGQCEHLGVLYGIIPRFVS